MRVDQLAVVTRASTKWHVYSLLLASLLFSGCRTAPVSAKQAYFQKHPELKAHYVQFYETSIEAIERCSDEKHMGKRTLVDSLRKDFAKYPDLVERLDAIKARQDDSWDGERQYLKQIKREFRPATDALFFYDYHKGDKEEQGWLILRRGEIHKKYWLGSSFDEPGEKP